MVAGKPHSSESGRYPAWPKAMVHSSIRNFSTAMQWGAFQKRTFLKQESILALKIHSEKKPDYLAAE